LNRMKLASFFIISITLHVAMVLAYPVPHATYVKAEFVPVTVLSFGAAESGTGSGLPAAKTNITPKPTRASAPKIVPGQPEPVEPAVSTAKYQQAVEAGAIIAAHMVVSASPVPEVAESMRLGAIVSDEKSHGAGGRGTGTGESNGGMGALGLGASGSGTGNGYGPGIGSPVTRLTQVSFRHTPPPDYPDAARKDGKEGRVILRVLVDEEGRSKLVEINLSSGSYLLDQAAAEAIKRWRFSPARYGDSPTASWVKIPVDFRLKEAK
jgi:protein TonB